MKAYKYAEDRDVVASHCTTESWNSFGLMRYPPSFRIVFCGLKDIFVHWRCENIFIMLSTYYLHWCTTLCRNTQMKQDGLKDHAVFVRWFVEVASVLSSTMREWPYVAGSCRTASRYRSSEVMNSIYAVDTFGYRSKHQEYLPGEIMISCRFVLILMNRTSS